MDSNAKFFLVRRNAEFLTFSSLEVRFLVDSTCRSCSNNKSLTNAKVEHSWISYSLTIDAQIVAAATTAHAHEYANDSDDGHQASTIAVRVVQLFSMADSRTARLRVLLPASNCHHCIACTYLFQPSLMWAGFPMKYTALSNRNVQQVAATSGRRNSVTILPGNCFLLAQNKDN